MVSEYFPGCYQVITVEILVSALEGESKAQELIRKKDHRATILHLVEEEYGKEAAQRLEVGAVDDNLNTR